MRLTLFLLVCSVRLGAQFSEFAVTDDGRLYFSTPLGTGQANAQFKVYKIASGELSLVAEGNGGANPFGATISGPIVSGDGAISGYLSYLPCVGGSCGLTGFPRGHYEFSGFELANSFSNAQISRNGRFLLGTGTGIGFDQFTPRVIELPSRKFVDVPATLCGRAQCVSNSGAVLMRRSGPGLSLLQFGGSATAISGTETATAGIVSPDGGLVAYELADGDWAKLFLTDSQGSAHRLLVAAPKASYVQPSFANDGTLLYFELDADGTIQPMVLPPGGEARRVASIAAGARIGIISGDAGTVWLGSNSGQLLLVNAIDGMVTEVIPETPYVRERFLYAYPGSVLRVHGTGLSQRTRFELGSVLLPISELAGQDAAAQLPWEYNGQSGSNVLVLRGEGNPFAQNLSFTLVRYPGVQFEVDTLGRAQIAHNDFRGVVSDADPAEPGETIHIFARNMGPVDRPVATGQRSPDSPPARVITPLACYIRHEYDGNPHAATGLRVPFAGLSGGSIGVYQIDVTIPAGWRDAKSQVECQMDAPDGFYNGAVAKVPIRVGE